MWCNFSHVSRHIWVHSRKQNKKCLGKTVLKKWSQIFEKMVNVSTKLLLEKSAKKKQKNKKKHSQSLADSWDKTDASGSILRPHYQHSFPKTFFPMFFTINSKISSNLWKLRHKVPNVQNLPHKSSNFTNNFFLRNFTYNLGHFSTTLRHHYKNSFSKKKNVLF